MGVAIGDDGDLRILGGRGPSLTMIIGDDGAELSEVFESCVELFERRWILSGLRGMAMIQLDS